MFEMISVKDAVELAYARKVLLYDIRSAEAYREGHLPMAQHMIEEYAEEKLKEQWNKKCVFYCDYGNRSMQLVRMLDQKGYGNAATMIGGYHAYEGYVETRKNDFWTMEWKDGRYS